MLRRERTPKLLLVRLFKTKKSNTNFNNIILSNIIFNSNSAKGGETVFQDQI
jgi:hypothetical protein